MGYYRILQELLYPLRLYNVTEGPSAAELYAVGSCLDEVQALLEEAEREAVPLTALDRGLSAYEEIMPFVPAFSCVEQRREAIMALLRIDWCSFSLEALRRTAAGCGMELDISESDTAETVEVRMPGVRGVPENFREISRRLEQILPCHLDILYIYVYTTWQELEAYIDNWQEIEDRALSWELLQIYEE